VAIAKALSWEERRRRVKQEAKLREQQKRDEAEVTKGLRMRVLARGDVNRMITVVSEARMRGEAWLSELGYGACSIDEVALLLPEGKNGDEWFQCMLGRVGHRGISYFNRDTDVVQCQPLPSEYDVEYYFFSTDVGVRLELLCLRGGYSPLHDLYRRSGQASSNNADVVHVSFKVANEAVLKGTYAELHEAGWLLGQDCTSRYGRFGYWRKPGEEGPMLWLKPRVNLRDAAKPLDEVHREDELPEIDEYDEEDEDDF